MTLSIDLPLSPGENQKILCQDALLYGSMNVVGEFVWGSNNAYLVRVTSGKQEYKAVYKPDGGETPLWDFPSGSLAQREVAAYLVSDWLHWELVPPTVYRQKAILGPGSVQLFIEHNPLYHYFTFSSAHRQRLQPVVLFDYLVNNADRKGSHILFDPHDHLWCIDHGLCFHVEDKLRTVIWDFAGAPLPEQLQHDLQVFNRRLNDPDSGFINTLGNHLRKDEIQSLEYRSSWLCDITAFPRPDPHRRTFPLPLV